MSHNDITGDKLVTNASTDAYRDGWDRIFGKKKLPEAPKVVEVSNEKELLEAQRQADAIRQEWYDYNLAQQDRSKPFPTFREFFENVYAPRNPERAQWLRETADKATGRPTMTFEKYMESRK